MIYILRLKGFNFNTNKLDDLIKIGYTEDSNFNSRMSQYKLHNPLISILFTINDCEEDIEKALHRYFREFIYDYYGKEWFNYDQKIIDFFNKYNTKELLEEKLKHLLNYTTKDDISLYKDIKLVINRWLCLISDDINSLKLNSSKIKSYISECNNNINKSIFVKEDIIKYLKNKYNISEDIEKDLLCYIYGNIKNSEVVNNFLADFIDKKLFSEKMGMLCTSGLTEAELGVVLDQIPLTYKKYYETLGPDRLKALGYNITRVEREYQATLFNKDDLKKEIFKLYQENNRYSKSYIKENLQQLYDNLGYTKKAKANDLEEYFEIKNCNIYNNDAGKYDHGFELIKRKD